MRYRSLSTVAVGWLTLGLSILGVVWCPSARADISVDVTPSSAEVCSGASQKFSATADVNGCESTNQMTYQWFVDGVAVPNATSSTYTTSFQYYTDGEGNQHIVSCAATIAGCGTGNGQATMMIDPGGVTIDYAYGIPQSSTPCVPIQFQASATACPSGTVTYLWDFGDGTTSTLQNPVHTFNPGQGAIYPWHPTVTLTASSGGHSSTKKFEVDIEACNCPNMIDLMGETGGDSTASSLYLRSDGSQTMSFCATLRDKSGTLVSGQQVTFVVSPANSGFSVSPATVTSNSKGQAITQVKCSGGARAFNASIIAKTTCGGQTQTSNEVSVYPGTIATGQDTDPSLFGVGFDTPLAISWYSASKFSSYIGSAIAEWQAASAKIKFTQGTAGSNKLFFRDVRNPGASWSAVTNIYLNSAGSKIQSANIAFNLYILDGDPSAISAPSDYPPASAPQHALLAIAAHEIGHALGLAHNTSTNDGNALMYPSYDYYYFQNKTQGPQVNETKELAVLYP